MVELFSYEALPLLEEVLLVVFIYPTLFVNQLGDFTSRMLGSFFSCGLW
jgi:hypothetical protein